MPGLEKNRIYRACIQGYSSEGLGIARIDGQVVFVHGAIRGEICDVLVMKVLKTPPSARSPPWWSPPLPAGRRTAPTTAAAAAATSGICPMRRSCGPSVPGSRTP